MGSEVPRPRGNAVDWKLERVSSVATQGMDVKKEKTFGVPEWGRKRGSKDPQAWRVAAKNKTSLAKER